jgi:signal transduction histidine kinase
MTEALQDLLEDTRMLAPHLQVSGDIQTGLWVQGDASLLRQVLHNLISNAIKYNAHSPTHPGWIRISTARWARRLEVVISNASDGIAVADRERIFGRFFRVDSAHSRAVEGVGLGLSVSREIARAHGGDLALKADRPQEVQFSLLMPVTEQSAIEPGRGKS